MRTYQVMFALGLGLILGGLTWAIHPVMQTWEDAVPAAMACLGGILVGMATPIIIEAIKQEK